jgi:hypothetical protein
MTLKRLKWTPPKSPNDSDAPTVANSSATTATTTTTTTTTTKKQSGDKSRQSQNQQAQHNETLALHLQQQTLATQTQHKQAADYEVQHQQAASLATSNSDSSSSSSSRSSNCHTPSISFVKLNQQILPTPTQPLQTADDAMQQQPAALTATGEIRGNPMVEERIDSQSQAMKLEIKRYSAQRDNAKKCNAQMDQNVCSNVVSNKHEYQPQLTVIDEY